MGLFDDQIEICAPFIQFMQSKGDLNKKMRENAVALAKEQNLDLDLDNVGTFTAVYGKDYDRSGQNGIIFYGRANNGWDEDCPDFRMESILDHLRSPFFNLIKRVSEHYFDDWYNHIAWSNVFKLTPFGECNDKTKWMFENGQNTNPSQTFREIQMEVGTEITKLEQDFLNPLVSILVTGYNIDYTWDETIWNNFPDCKQIGEDVIWYEDNRCKRMAGLFVANGRFFIQTDRPEMLPLDNHVTAIIKLIDEVKKINEKGKRY